MSRSASPRGRGRKADAVSAGSAAGEPPAEVLRGSAAHNRIEGALSRALGVLKSLKKGPFLSVLEHFLTKSKNHVLQHEIK